MTRLRVKATDHLGNVAFIHNVGGGWRCNLGNGISASLSHAGIKHENETECLLDLADVSTPEEVLGVILRHARYYLSGPKAGETACTYEVSTSAVAARTASGVAAVSAPFNAAQQTVLRAYADGDYAHITTLDECEQAGDTLFLFLMRELADSEGCDTADEAARRVGMAIDQLTDLARELRPI